jgi:hypothetical protein
MKGKRARYLHPIKMYVFTSAIFFLLFFSVFKPVVVSHPLDTPIPNEKRAAYVEKLQSQLSKDTGNLDLQAKLAKAKDSSQVLTKRDTTTFDRNKRIIRLSKENYKTWAEFDSSQKALPKKERYGWFMRQLMKKQIEINTKYWDRPDEALEKFVKSLLQKLPYMLFISLPLFALILKFVYIRRKQFYYADHGVFTIHLYIFTFMTLLLIFSIERLEEILDRQIFGYVIALLVLGLFAYLYRAMRRFYGQRRFKTFIKFLIVLVLSIVMMFILFLGLTLFSAVTF